MEAGSTGFFGLSASTLALILLITLIAVGSAYMYYRGRLTVPLPSYKSGFTGKEGFLGSTFKYITMPWYGGVATSEGFGGAAVGTGEPDCLRTSSEAAALYAMFTDASSADLTCDKLRELKQLLGKLACFKKDLVSPSYIVDSTRSQKYVTSQDIEPVAETTARCFSKTISPRDLEISFDKWNMRGMQLVKSLAASFKLCSADVDKAEGLFNALMRDVKDIARGTCLQGEPRMGGKPGPRDAHPYEPPTATELGKFTGYY